MTIVDSLKKLGAAIIGGGLTPDHVPGRTAAEVIDYIARVKAGEQLGELKVSSAAGSTNGMTKITVTPTKTEGNSYVYKTNIRAIDTPEYFQEIDSSYTSWDGKSDIAGEDGHRIGIYEINSDNCVVKFGQAVISANLGRRSE